MHSFWYSGHIYSVYFNSRWHKQIKCGFSSHAEVELANVNAEHEADCNSDSCASSDEDVDNNYYEAVKCKDWYANDRH